MKVHSMKKISALLFALSTLASTAHSQYETWTASVVQGAQQVQSPGEIRIKRAPFKLVFSAPSDFGFAVLASIDCSEIRSLTTTQSISQAIRPTNLASEGKTEKNTFLVVNGPGAIQSEDNTAHVWAEDPENDLHSFQTFQSDSRKQMTATREIREIVQYNNFKDSRTIPIAQYASGSICLLITGLPPVGRMVHDSPRIVHVHFD